MKMLLFYMLFIFSISLFQPQFCILMYRVMSEELAVAAIAVFPVLLVGRRRGTGAPLRAAVFILPLLQLR